VHQPVRSFGRQTIFVFDQSFPPGVQSRAPFWPSFLPTPHPAPRVSEKKNSVSFSLCTNLFFYREQFFSFFDGIICEVVCCSSFSPPPSALSRSLRALPFPPHRYRGFRAPLLAHAGIHIVTLSSVQRPLRIRSRPTPRRRRFSMRSRSVVEIIRSVPFPPDLAVFATRFVLPSFLSTASHPPFDCFFFKFVLGCRPVLRFRACCFLLDPTSFEGYIKSTAFSSSFEVDPSFNRAFRPPPHYGRRNIQFRVAFISVPLYGDVPYSRVSLLFDLLARRRLIEVILAQQFFPRFFRTLPFSSLLNVAARLSR